MSLGLLVQEPDDGWGDAYVDGGGGGFDWGTNITNWLKLTPNIIAATQGHPYGSTPYGQQGAPSAYVGGQGQGAGVYAGGSLLGASGFGQISTTTLLLIGVVAIVLLRKK